MTSSFNGMIIKYEPERWLLRAGFLLLVLFTILSLSACYYAPYRIASRPPPEDTGEGAGVAPLTQVYFYPKAGQTPEQQDRDCYECYNWAVRQTGFDPNMSSFPQEQRVAVVPVPPPGHDTAAGAVAGAVLGALAAGPRHAPGGVLIGAAVGALAGAASDSARQESAQQLEEAYAEQDRARDAQLKGKALEFRRAMSACLEGRGYTVQ